MTVSNTALREEIIDREAIRDCLNRYSRGVDRCDEDMLRSVYWEDAVDTHLVFTGNREEFIAWVLPKAREMDCMHMLCNILICHHGDHADTETYFHSYHRAYRENGTPYDFITAGRYLDRFEKRGDEWRIAMRHVVLDWFRDYADSGDWAKGPHGLQVKPGSRRPDDESYRLLNMI